MNKKEQESISIYLFGTPVIKVGQEPFLLKRKRSRALIYYLAVSPVPVSRQELIMVLFPQMNDATAFKNLSTYLHNINTDIPGLLDVDKEFIEISKSVKIDVREFEACFQGKNLNRETAERAKRIYKDTFLKHFHLDDSYEFEQWGSQRSEYYKNKVINAMAYIADDLYVSGKYGEALDVMMEVLDLDPYREDIYVRAMKANYKLGNRPGAVKLYEKLNNLLSEEMGISPMPETICLYSDIITEKPICDTLSVIKKDEHEKGNIVEKKWIFEHFSDQAKMLLAILSISRNKFNLKMIANAMKISEQEVLYALDEIRKKDIVAIGNDNSIIFCHSEDRSKVLECISIPEQSYLNHRLATVIEENSFLHNDKIAEDLLYYYQKSGDKDKILEYALLIGEKANDREEFCKALECYKHACKYLEGEKLLEMKSSIAQIELLIGDIDSAREVLLENEDYARQNYQFGLACAFELEAYLAGMDGFQEILWGIKPQYPMKKDEKQLSNIWIAEHHLQQEPENIYYYIRFLECKALYYEFLMCPEDAVEVYEKIVKLCKDNKNTRLKNYIDLACVKLGIYHKDSNQAEKYLRIGIAHANEHRNFRTLPSLLAASAKLDISLGRLMVPKYNLDWAASLASNYNNVYVQFVVEMAVAELKLSTGQEKEAVYILQKLLERSVKRHANHVQVAVLRKLLSIEDEKIDRIYYENMLKKLTKTLPLSDL